MNPDRMNIPNSLLYLPSINRFVDSEWYIIHDLEQLFDTWQLDLCRKTGEDIAIEARDGTIWKLLYLNEWEEKEVLGLISWNEYYDINMIRDRYYV